MTLKLQDITGALDIARECGRCPNNPITPYMEVNWETAEVTFYGAHQSERGSMSMQAFHGHCSTWPIPSVSALTVQDELEDVLPLIRAASEQYYARHDGSNFVAAWRDLDALEEARRAAGLQDGSLPDEVDPDDTAIGAALRAIETFCDELSHEEFVGYWPAGDYMEHDSPADLKVTVESTDEELAARAKEIVEDAEGENALLDVDDVQDHLERVREQLAKECYSGLILGVDCASGIWGDDDLAIVEYMPEQFRASHKAAGNSGVYPVNGAIRVRCCKDCADEIVENEPEWAEIVTR